MLQQVFFIMGLCLSLGAVVLNGILYYVAYRVQAKGKGVSPHYFEIERGPSKRTATDTVMDCLTSLYMLVALLLVSVLLLIAVYARIICNIDYMRLNEIVAYLQNIFNKIFSILISVIIFFSGIRKNYQTFFPRDNRIRRYKIFPLCAFSIACGSISVILGLVSPLTEANQHWQLSISAITLLTLIMALASSGYVTLVSIVLAFSPSAP